MLQALESTADQIDHLAEIIEEFLTMGEAGHPMSATRRQKYAAEMAELRGQRAQLRALVHESELARNEPNPQFLQRPMAYESGLPRSVI